MNFEEWLTQADLYSAGALTEVEEKEFEDRLNEGDDISKKLNEVIVENRNALSAVNLNIPIVVPPPELKDKIMKKSFKGNAGGKGASSGRFSGFLFIALIVIIIVAVAFYLFFPQTPMQPEFETPVIKAEIIELAPEPTHLQQALVEQVEKQVDFSKTPEMKDDVSDPFEFVDSLKNKSPKDSPQGRDILVGIDDVAVDIPSNTHSVDKVNTE